MQKTKLLYANKLLPLITRMFHVWRNKNTFFLRNFTSINARNYVIVNILSNWNSIFKKHTFVWRTVACKAYAITFGGLVYLILMRIILMEFTQGISEQKTLSKTPTQKWTKQRSYLQMVSYWSSILQYFWPALSDNRSWKPMFGLLLSGPLRQVSLCL